MSEDKQNQSIKLPERLVSSIDLSRVNRELRALDIWLTQAALRSGGQEVKPPKTSATLEEVASINEVSLLDKTHREELINALTAFMEHAPKVHISYAVEPSAAFLNRMIVWLRKNISPIVLLEVGLQPTIVAGCTVRTTNKVFDMSLRHRFVDSRPLLVESIAKFQETASSSPGSTETVATQSQSSAPIPSAPPISPAQPPQNDTQQKDNTKNDPTPQASTQAQPEVSTKPAEPVTETTEAKS